MKNLISTKQLNSISDFLNLYKQVQSVDIGCSKSIKIAFMSSSTIKGLKEVLFLKCAEADVLANFYEAGYNQYLQEAINKSSGLYAFNPNLIILSIDIRSICGDAYLTSYMMNIDDRKKWIDEVVKDMNNIIRNLKQNSYAKILFHNFEVPLYSPLGVLENKQECGFVESVQIINRKLCEEYKRDQQVFIFDYDAFCSAVGKRIIMDPKMYYMGDIKIAFQHMPELADTYLSYIKPLVGLTRKCLVMDLDNTLWGGVVGEDGIEEIKLGPTPEGRPFWELQRYILSLFSRGVILAINSKNNYNDAIEVFRKHPYMIIKENNISSIQINWNDKVANMKAIAEDLNIGLNSLVFIDDDKLNCEIVREALPEVKVVELPDDTSLYLNTLMQVDDFNTIQLTSEDYNKSRMYAQQRQRTALKDSTGNIEEYLAMLNMKVTINRPIPVTIPRIAQLTQKTNQFNMTTRRYQEEDIKRFDNDAGYLVYSVGVEDKFGDNGLTGVMIIDRKTKKWRIDTFLLSCRVIGRRIEDVMLAYIAKKAKEEGADSIIGEFLPTVKNEPAKKYYAEKSFQNTAKNDLHETWECDLSRNYDYPSFINVIEKV